jgi:hypothetical protein
MIQMPHRNVTRFFIPLIDVLILLFCIFLLMDFNSKAEVGEQSEIVEEKTESLEQLESDLRKRTKELQEFEELRPKLTELKQLLEENQRLRNANQQSLQQRSFFKIIDISRKDGTISFYDETRQLDPVIPLPNEKAAQVLIERHQADAKQAKRPDVYYYFMRARPSEEDQKQGRLGSGFPTIGQINRYKKWFAGVANNLGEYH